MARGRKHKEDKPTATVTSFSTIPTAPPYLDEVATERFGLLVAVLVEAGTIGQTDPMLIEMYGINYSLLQRATIELQTQPLNMVAENGRSFINPLVGALHNTTQKLTSIISLLGLCPVAVAKLSVEPRKEADPLDDFVKWAKGTGGKEQT